MPDTLGYDDNNAEAIVESTFGVVINEICGEFHQHGT